MLKSLVCLCLAAFVSSQLVNIPHGHELRVLVDKGFDRLDHSPKDGMVSLNEYDFIITHDDVDGDGCVTKAEYFSVQHGPDYAKEKMFAHFDHDNDGCMRVDDMATEYSQMDKNDDGQVTLHEFEQYMTHLVNAVILGHGHVHV